MNLRDFCRLPDFPTAVLTTYNIDPLFFERVVLYGDLAAEAEQHGSLFSLTPSRRCP